MLISQTLSNCNVPRLRDAMAFGGERADWEAILDGAWGVRHDEAVLRVLDGEARREEWRREQERKLIWCAPAPACASVAQPNVFRRLFVDGGSATTRDTWWDGNFVAVDGVSGKLQSWVDYIDAAHLLTQTATGRQCALPSADASMGNALTATFDQAVVNYYDCNRAIAASDYFSSGSGCTAYLVHVPGTFVSADYMFATTGNTTQGMDVYRASAILIAGRIIPGSADTVVVTGVVTGTATYLEYLLKTGSSPAFSGRLKNGTAATHTLGSATGAQVALRVGARPVTGVAACNMRMRSFYGFRREHNAAQKTVVQQFIQKDTGIFP